MANWSQNVSALIAVAGLVCSSPTELHAQNSHRDLSGTWRENLQRSRRIDGRDISDLYTRHEMTLEHAGVRLRVSLDIRVPKPGTDRLITYELQTDGRVYEFALGGGKASAYARWEGDSLTTYLRRHVPGSPVVEVIRTMKIDALGRTMQAEMRSWRDGQAANHIMEVWERQ